MYILGLSGYYHDSAACLLKNGEISGAVQEERFTRKKHDASFPSSSLSYAKEKLGISEADIEAVVFYEKPTLKLFRKKR